MTKAEIVAEIEDKKVISAELEAKMKEVYQLFSDGTSGRGIFKYTICGIE